MKITDIDQGKLEELKKLKGFQEGEEQSLKIYAKQETKAARAAFIKAKKYYENVQAEAYKPAHKKAHEIRQTQHAIACLVSPIQEGDVVAVKKYRQNKAWSYTSLDQKMPYFQTFKVQHVSVHIFEKPAKGVNPFSLRFNTTLIRKKDGSLGKNHSFRLDEIDHIISRASKEIE
jgi:ribonuclease BN (tRNA processing enzyme)